MPDVIVVGGGVAGLRAAIEAKRAGADVVLLSKAHPTRSYSINIQDGINAAIAGGDSRDSHAEDTIMAGDFLAEQDRVERLVQEAPQIIRQLDRMGVPFNRNPHKEFATFQAPGASGPRCAYVNDMSGHVLVQVLYEQALQADVTLLEEWFVASLNIDGSTCRGVTAVELSSGRVQHLPAKAVVLATGGARRIFDPSTASLLCSGDGMALAYRVGVPLVDMEFVQFHPYVVKGTPLALSDLLVTPEAAVVNKDGTRFLEAVGQKEMTYRDVGARALAAEIREGRGEDGSVKLKVSIDPSQKKSVFHNTSTFLSSLAKLDLVEDGLPVRPAMYRNLGGIDTDGQGATAVKGLYAAGACAWSGIHGANLLGGDELMVSVALGAKAGTAAAEYASSLPTPTASDGAVSDLEAKVNALLDQGKGEETIGGLLGELSSSMSDKAGLLRDAASLAEVSEKLPQLKERYQKVGLTNHKKAFNFELPALLELGVMLDTAQAIVSSASARQESRGSHFRSDFPRRDDQQWLKHTLASYAEGGPKLDYRPVTVTKWQPKPRES